MLAARIVTILGCALVLSSSASAAVIRYALVVGNDHGLDAAGEARPALRHAARDATRLRAALIAQAGFDDGPRTVLLTNTSRRELLDAIDAVGQVIARDRAAIPHAKVLFALFYSGHGAESSLLLRDGPLGGAELSVALSRLPTDIRIGSFDACHSASLAAGHLTAKGMTPIPEFNLVRELPDAALNAAGSVWFFSSAADEVSFEDRELGGLFTHFFIEALSRAGGSKPSASLDEIWDYTRRKTVAYARQRHRVQTPTRVDRTHSTGPVIFSWRHERPTTLVFGPALAGRVALYYRGDVLLTFDKAPGRTVERAVYPGLVELALMGSDQHTTWRQRLDLPPGGRVLVGQGQGEVTSPLGYAFQPVSSLSAKGPLSGVHASDALAVEREALSVAVGLGYQLDGGTDVVLAPAHSAQLELRFDHGAWVGAITGGIGVDHNTYETWGYSLSAVGGGLRVGRARDFAPVRLSATFGARLGRVWQEFEGGSERVKWFGAGVGGLALSWSLGEVWAVAGTLEVGARYAAGVGVDSPMRWSLFGSLGVGVLARFL